MASVATTAARVKRVTESLLTLPALPTVVARLIQAVDNPKVTAAQMGALIEQDQVLTARILKVANSSFYAFPRQIGTVQLALVVMGFDAIKELALGLSAQSAFRAESAHPRFQIDRFWQHSLAVASGCRLLATRFGGVPEGEAFVAGLLHDIGKLVLNQYLPKEFAELQQALMSPEAIPEKVEMALLGVTHGEVGSWLGERWNLPSVLCQAMRWHGEPWLHQGMSKLPLMVHIADWMAHHMRLGEPGTAAQETMDARAVDLMNSFFGISLEDLPILSQQLLVEFDRAGQFLGE
jgi:HD-like signal output (HDOD) protein